MNKLITTPNGGFPFVLDDLRWIDDGIRDGFKGLASFLGTNCILSGVTLTGFGTSSFTYTAGYILLNGEVLAIDASAAPLDTATNTYVYVEVVNTYDAAGLKVFENSTTADTYQIRKAVITAYSTAQAGKTTLVSLKTAENLISDMIVNYTHSYTKRQSWALGADDALASGSEVIPINNTTGNCFTLDVAAYDTPITRFSAPMPNGTWSAVRFSYTLGPKSVVISDGLSLTNGIDTNGKSYVFNNGEIAWFIWIAGKARLVNGWRINDPWHVVGDTGQPAFETGWIASGSRKLRYALNEMGEVVLRGTATIDTWSSGSTVFTLPSGYRPVETYQFAYYDITEDITFQLQIGTDGKVKVFHAGSIGSVTFIVFDTIRFSTL